ncbi:MAG TPA: hypothetical protein VFW47_01285, partial [Phenylobacterium sp.]|nr:hypothetical protein [Phenylobacterium sp.]
PPVIVSVPPGMVVCLLGVAAIVYDWRTRGKPHPVYLIGLPLVMAQMLLNVPIGASDQWMAIARGVESLAG